MTAQMAPLGSSTSRVFASPHLIKKVHYKCFYDNDDIQTINGQHQRSPYYVNTRWLAWVIMMRH